MSADRTEYVAPSLTDYGRLEDLTENNAVPQFVDVPQGTPVGVTPIVGDDPFPMS